MKTSGSLVSTPLVEGQGSGQQQEIGCTQGGQAGEGQDTENVVQEAGPLVQDAGLEVSHEVREAGQDVLQEERQGAHQGQDAHRENSC